MDYLEDEIKAEIVKANNAFMKGYPESWDLLEAEDHSFGSACIIFFLLAYIYFLYWLGGLGR